ncbi:hypothetical protein RB628_10290 [Streptomyces sp. ADMS]|nr:hypothetical protein [Streptomyces sp. ADMS]MDW4905719.1 hypothetical protein [Streptomyces sp. ADMS]
MVFGNGFDVQDGWGPGQLHAVNRGQAKAPIPRLAAAVRSTAG